MYADIGLLAVDAASYALGTATAFAGPALLGYYFLAPDKTSPEEQAKEDEELYEKPSSDKSETPISSSEPTLPTESKVSIQTPSSSGMASQINLKRYKLDISNYTRQDLKADRSFIRAFYYIRNNRDATDEELKDFVETNLVKPIAALEKNDWRRVYNVMHYVAKPNKDPYVAFFHIKEAFSKLLYGGFTVKELLDVANFSDSFLIFLGTSEANLNKFRGVVDKILVKNKNFYDKTPDDQLPLVGKYVDMKRDTTTVPLFQNLLSKMKQKETLMASVKKSLQEECDNLLKSEDSDSYRNHNKRYNDFIQSLSEPSSPEVAFTDRCGVGDVLASFTDPVICVTYIQANQKQYNFGCKDRFQTNPDNYVIYMHENHHCELLIPKSKPKSNSQAPPKTPSVSKPGVQAAVKPKEDSCKKYEDDYFLKGGTRKRKRRKYIPKKSRRKGKKRT